MVVPVCGPDIIAKLSPQALICDPRSSSQLRVTSVSTFDQLRVTSVSTFDRARCEAPSPAPGFGNCFSFFQLAGALSTGQYKWAVSKQRKRPQTANRLEGIKNPRGVEHGGNGCSGLWTRHYRQLMFCNIPFLCLAMFPTWVDFCFLKLLSGTILLQKFAKVLC